MKAIDVLLILMVLSWVAFLVICFFMLRRIPRRLNSVLGVAGGVQPGQGKTPLITFDEAREVFRWEGTFDEKKAAYIHSVEAGHITLRLEAGRDTLTVAYFSRDFREDDPFARLPYRVEINARTVYRSDLLEGEGEPVVQGLLEAYFERGLKSGIERLSLPQMEVLEALLFGYQTYRRFVEFLNREHPDFVRQVKEYRGKPLLELLEPFRGGEKSREELLIEMRRAISEEDYERAAIIRDHLRALDLRGRQGGPSS